MQSTVLVMWYSVNEKYFDFMEGPSLFKKNKNFAKLTSQSIYWRGVNFSQNIVNRKTQIG